MWEKKVLSNITYPNSCIMYSLMCNVYVMSERNPNIDSIHYIYKYENEGDFELEEKYV